MAPPELLALLRDKASGGLLPRWTDWWDEEEVAPLLPDQATRQAVTEEQPRLPLSYFEASVPVPAGWEAHLRAYLLFGPPYAELAADWGSPRPNGDPMVLAGGGMGAPSPTDQLVNHGSRPAAESGPSPRGPPGPRTTGKP